MLFQISSEIKNPTLFCIRKSELPLWIKPLLNTNKSSKKTCIGLILTYFNLWGKGKWADFYNHLLYARHCSWYNDLEVKKIDNALLSRSLQSSGGGEEG